jgi:hypothetical protein
MSDAEPETEVIVDQPADGVARLTINRLPLRLTGWSTKARRAP